MKNPLFEQRVLVSAFHLFFQAGFEEVDLGFEALIFPDQSQIVDMGFIQPAF